MPHRLSGYRGGGQDDRPARYPGRQHTPHPPSSRDCTWRNVRDFEPLTRAHSDAVAPHWRDHLAARLTFELVVFSRHGGTITTGPNFGYDLQAVALDRRADPALDLADLRLAFNGSEPVRAASVARFEQVLGPLRSAARGDVSRLRTSRGDPRGHVSAAGPTPARRVYTCGPAGGCIWWLCVLALARRYQFSEACSVMLMLMAARLMLMAAGRR
jgi:hypothetical protein